MSVSTSALFPSYLKKSHKESMSSICISMKTISSTHSVQSSHVAKRSFPLNNEMNEWAFLLLSFNPSYVCLQRLRMTLSMVFCEFLYA